MVRDADDFRLPVADVLRYTRRRRPRALPPKSVDDVFVVDCLSPDLRVRAASSHLACRTGTVLTASPLGWRVQLDGMRESQIVKANHLHPIEN